MADTHDHTTAADDAGETTSRRGLALAAAAAIGAIVAAPKEASAQLFGGADAAQLGAILAVLREILALLIGAERYEVPPEPVEVLNEQLGHLGTAGADSVTRSSTVVPAIGRSYPEEPLTTPVEQRTHAIFTAEATAARCIEALHTTASCGERQGEVVSGQMALVERIQQAESPTDAIKGVAALLGGLSAQIAQTNVQLAALASLLTDQAVRASEDGRRTAQDVDGFLGGAGRVIPPANLFRSP